MIVFHMPRVSCEGPALRLMRLDRGLRVPLQLIGSKQRTALPTRGFPLPPPVRDRVKTKSGRLLRSLHCGTAVQKSLRRACQPDQMAVSQP